MTINIANLIGKDKINGMCLGLNTKFAESCALDGNVCLDKESEECVMIDGANQWIGRDKDSGHCLLGMYEKNSDYCHGNYCILAPDLNCVLISN